MTRPFHAPPLQIGQPARAPAFRAITPLRGQVVRAYPLAPVQRRQRPQPQVAPVEPAQDALLAWSGLCGTG